MKNISKGLVFISLSLLLGTSCEPTKRLLSVEAETHFTQLTPPTDSVLVFVIRNSKAAFIIKTGIYSDTTWLGTTGSMSFIVATIPLGKQTLGIHGAENSFKLPVTAESGKTYYYQQRMKTGILFARSDLLLLDQNTGKKKLITCRPAEKIPQRFRHLQPTKP